MRIETVQFSNINSLKGTWKIDFTNEALQDSGLFLITGPTGAGKTTILDAICLALYGRTPRLKEMNAGHNEAMNRHSGECLAEVVFATEKGRYRARWYQHRARTKPGGRLQPPKLEFEDMTNAPGESETISREVAARVVEATGMTYEQFTRAMMLAQGEFARFLAAKPEERSPMLEDITGTEIYSRISQRVFEMHKAEAERLKEYENVCKGIAVLSEEERAALEVELGARNLELAGAAEGLGRLNEQVACLEEGEELACQQRKACEAHEAAVKANDALADTRRILERDRLAATLAGLESETQAAKDECQRLEASLAGLNEQLPLLEKQEVEAALGHERAKGAHEDAKKELADARGLFVQVRALDKDVESAESALSRSKKESSGKARDVKGGERDLAKARAALENDEKKLGELQEELEKTRADAGLAGELSALKDGVLRLERANADAAARQKEAKARLGEVEKLEKELKKAEGRAKKAAEALGRAQEAEASERRDLKERFGKDFASASDLLGQASRRLNAIRDLHESLDALDGTIEDALSEAAQVLSGREELERLAAGIGELEEKCAQNARETAGVAELVASLQKQIELKVVMQSLEEHRARLERDCPCPLCGSLEHPYAQGVDLAVDDDRENLKRRSKDLDALRKEGMRLAGGKAALESDRANTGTRAARHEDALKSLAGKLLSMGRDQRDVLAGAGHEEASDEERALAGECLELLGGVLETVGSFVQDIEDLEEQAAGQADREAMPEGNAKAVDEQSVLKKSVLEQLQEGLKARDASSLRARAGEHRRQAQKELKAIEDASSRLEKLARTAEAARDGERAARDALAQAASRLDLAREQARSAEQNLEDAKKAAADELAKLCRTLVPYGLEDRAEDPDLANLLQKRRDARAALEKGHEALALKVRDEKKDIGTFEEALEKAREELKKLLLADQENERALLEVKERRAGLFGEKKVDEEEKRLQDAESKAAELEVAAQAAHVEAQKRIAEARSAIESVTGQLEGEQGARKRLSASLEAFQKGLEDKGFASHEEWASCRLGEKERVELDAQTTRARDAVLSCETTLKDLAGRMAANDKKRRRLGLLDLEPEPLEGEEADAEGGAGQLVHLKKVRDEVKAGVDELQKTIGAMTESLRNDAQAHARLQDELDRIEEQRKVAARWLDLNQLIGSADGKRFRNFAQGITFAKLVRCANVELATLTDRYVLTTDPDNPLEFNVVDAWQGNERRSVKNLSGGETFLVSLALALGLSALAGGRLHIGTMFLDEGFGTLDPEALESAINTLAGLRGRGAALIGIISHVEALRERIDTQIELARGNDGTSVLFGPGCVRVK